MSEMIERVARKLCARAAHDPDAFCSKSGLPLWQAFDQDARAVMLAMREASEEVLEAGAASPYCMSDPGPIWRAMIDKAVGPEPSRGIPLSGEELPF